jgi:hypothetical protein
MGDIGVVEQGSEGWWRTRYTRRMEGKQVIKVLMIYLLEIL